MADMTFSAKHTRPSLSRADAKARNTNDTARAIIDAEANAREAKTAKLRAARLAMEEIEAANPPAIAAPKKPRAKAVKTAKAR